MSSASTKYRQSIDKPTAQPRKTAISEIQPAAMICRYFVNASHINSGFWLGESVQFGLLLGRISRRFGKAGGLETAQDAVHVV